MSVSGWLALYGLEDLGLTLPEINLLWAWHKTYLCPPPGGNRSWSGEVNPRGEAPAGAMGHGMVGVALLCPAQLSARALFTNWQLPEANWATRPCAARVPLPLGSGPGPCLTAACLAPPHSLGPASPGPAKPRAPHKCSVPCTPPPCPVPPNPHHNCPPPSHSPPATAQNRHSLVPQHTALPQPRDPPLPSTLPHSPTTTTTTQRHPRPHSPALLRGDCQLS